MNNIRNTHNCPHYTWGNLCSAWILQQSEHLIVKEELMPPNAMEQLHYHQHTEQFFYVLEGTATFLIDGMETTVPQTSGITIPKASRHCVSNFADRPLRFLVISAPGNKDDRIYQSIPLLNPDHLIIPLSI